MLEVDIEKIIPVTDARDSLNQIIETVEGTDALYVITKNGKPSAIIVGVHHLEKLTGMKTDELSVDEEEAPASVASETVAPVAETPTVEESSQPAPAPFTMTTDENDVFAPLPEPEATVAPLPAEETPADSSQMPAEAPAPAMPATPPAQAPTDQA
ncbi:MAG: type II toxin-antitoxin system Phd/YefM family antitoxin [Candidatus Berkelbacteria bacterium]